MRSKWMYLLTVTLITTSIAILFADLRPASAQGGGGRIQARAQIRRTVDPSPRGPVGKLLLVEDGTLQTFRVQIRQLSQTDLSIVLSTNSFFDGTNSPVAYVSPLNRTGVKEGNWSQKLIGTNGAPAQFQLLGVDNLSDMSDILSIDAAIPGETNVVGGTNFITETCTISNGITVCTLETNILGGVTQIFFQASVWAPLPPLVAKPSVFNFKQKSAMALPPVPPSPKASGTISFSYNGNQGRSRFDVRISGMAQGQSYVLWVSDAGTNFITSEFELNTKGGSGRFRRDTKKGDPLPTQAAESGDLTNRVMTVRDAFGVIHLAYIP